jgi:hypothetical protein
LPSEYSISWKNCGAILPDNGPVIKKIDIKKDFGASGGGKTDDSEAFRKAIDSVTGSAEIFIPEGEYLLRSPIVIKKDNIYLTGAGADKTRLIFDLNGTTLNCINICGTISSDTSKALDGLEKGSTRIKIENSGAIEGSRFAAILQDNDPAIMYTKPEWNQSWAKDSVGQVFAVKSVKDGFVELEEPLHITFRKEMSARLVRVNAVSGCAVSAFYVKRLDKGDSDIIHIENAANCLVDNIESELVLRSHLSITTSYKCSVKNSYFHHAYDYGGGGHGYGVELKHWTSNCLVENNIFVHLRHSMMVHQGANGNVFGYNYSKDPVATGDHDPNSLVCDISVHGHYAFMNLFESNIIQKVEISDYWGPTGPGNTFLRNRIETEGVRINDKTSGENFIGNIIVNADYGIEPAPGAPVSNILTQANIDYGELGYDASTKDREIPVSLYLDEKPDFIKNAKWPLLGPDVKGVQDLPSREKAELK